ncbi:proline-rich protein 15-like protein isoform X1 [Natator depressus]|uniref:proline-rich protein 15-like protein isoform X1 n=1 Tax=Natator depressus TaxID=27790 RepID=UPI003EBB7C31
MEPLWLTAPVGAQARLRDTLLCHQQGKTTMAENYSWWKLTFLRKKKSTPKVLYESPDIYANENHQEATRTEVGSDDGAESEFNVRLEKIVDKNTKGKHVKVSNSGRFKEKKKVRSTLAENPNLFTDGEREEK